MPKPQVVCVLGMHRSGTSLIARVVNLLGFFLGPEEHLMKLGPDNPAGYWEHQLLTDLNDEILARLGGSWHEPPSFPPNWKDSSELADLRQKAQALIQEEFGARPWGWKDPRTCLTLPFWQRLLPKMGYVICLRNPVDVAHSLERRNGFSYQKSADLWLTYIKSALGHTTGQSRLLLFYEDFMANWRQELQRLARFLGASRQIRKTDVQRALKEFVRRDLHHNRTSLLDAINEPELAFPTRALYVALRMYVTLRQEERGERTAEDRILQRVLDVFSQHSTKAQVDIDRLHMQDERITQILGQLDQTRKELDQSVSNIQSLMAEKVRLSEELGKARDDLAQRESMIQRLEADRSILFEQLNQTKNELSTIKESLGYYFMRFYAKKIDKLFPEGTSRGKFRKTVMTYLRMITDEDVRVLPRDV